MNHYSKREVQVILLMALGFKLGVIARITGLSPKTTSTYLKRIADKDSVDGFNHVVITSVGMNNLSSNDNAVRFFVESIGECDKKYVKDLFSLFKMFDSSGHKNEKYMRIFNKINTDSYE